MSKRHRRVRVGFFGASVPAEFLCHSRFEALERRCLLSGSGPLVISEFMADNTHTLQDTNGDFSDWIEIQNPTGSSINLDGYYLTDNQNQLAEWKFPTGVSIPANGFKVVFASGKDRTVATAELHTNFKLDAGGEYLALVQPDGVTIASDYSPEYPAQLPDVSYGIYNGAEQYFASPTPGTANNPATTSAVSDTIFSVDRGFYDTAFPLSIATRTVGATIRYTTDGTKPTATTGTVYAGPITISKTTTLRAAAFKPGLVSTNVDTETYIFLDDIVRQSNQSVISAGLPGSWNGTTADYAMDPTLVGPGAPYASEIKNDLKAIPTLSIVLPVADMFGSNGIYSNPTSEGQAWERSTSVELIDPNNVSSDMQIDAGIQIQGGAFRSPGLTNKHSFRLLFKDIWGPSKLEDAFFGKDATDIFDSITLRADANDGWSWDAVPYGVQPDLALYSRDMWSHATQLAMGDPSSHATRMHLYINGVYWGLYDPVERPDASFAADYIGGSPEQWDVLNIDGVTDGNGIAWNTMVSMANDVANAPTEALRTAAYQKLQGNNPDGTDNPAYQDYLDVDDYIDYMLMNIFSGNVDWPANNWYAGRFRDDNGIGSSMTGFKFFSWDAESSLNLWSPLGTNRVDVNASVAQPYSLLRSSLEFRQEFADRAQKMLYNNGPLSTTQNVARLQGILDGANQAIVAESARWGDQHYTPGFTKTTWQTQANYVLQTWLPQRWSEVVGQLQGAGLLSANAPTFNTFGGLVAPNFNLVMTAPTGTVYYTLDGSDPRLIGGGINTGAIGAAQSSISLIPVGSDWKYWDKGTLPDPLWNAASYSDTAWAHGPAELGYGDGDETTTVGYGPDPQKKYITTYFRKSITISNVSEYATAHLRLLRDDGAVIYINGTEVARSNMLAGAVGNTTLAATSVEDATFYDYDVPISALTNGTNVIAVEIHQGAVTSSDISFNLELTATTSPTPVVLPSGDTLVSARTRDASGNWSGITRALFHTDSAAAMSNLAITEVNYNPQNAEVSLGESGSNDNFEFIELMNTSAAAVTLEGVNFLEGLDFTFPLDVSLAPGERAVLVSNVAAFRSRYGNGPRILGTYTGNLANSGDQIIMHAADGSLIRSFHYQDSGDWPNRPDGEGSSLEEVNPTGDESDPKNWRSSSEYGGTPGAAGAGPASSVIVNELLANPNSGGLDAIELYNSSAASINVGGWYLSDSSTNYRKFKIPANTTIPAGGYLTYNESTLGFSLSASGEDVWVLQADPSTTRLTRFMDHVEFGATATGESLGCWPNGLASSNFYPMTSTTIGAANSGPRIGPVVINEIMYAPAGTGSEFIELRNVTGADVPIAGWQFSDGIDYTFPAGATVPANGYALLVAGDPTAFRNANPTVPGTVSVYGNYLIGGFVNVLNNAGEQIVLSRQGTPVLDVTPYTEVDRVTYDDVAPWPVSASGSGPSLGRVNSFAWADTSTNWAAEVNGGSPGKANFGGGSTVNIASRSLFYNNSKFDAYSIAALATDATALATDKTALLPGHTATSANFSNFTDGITGIFIDFNGVPTGPLTFLDFAVKVGNTDAAGSWAAGVSPTVTVLPGIGGPTTSRVALTWAAGTMKNEWVQITVLANTHTNLTTSDVFYFGNLIGDTTGDGNVDVNDYYGVRDNLRTYSNPAPVDWKWDLNRDGVVDAIDLMLTRSNATTAGTALRMIATPASVIAPPVKVTPPATVTSPTSTPTSTSAPTPTPTPTSTKAGSTGTGLTPGTPVNGSGSTTPTSGVPKVQTRILRRPITSTVWFTR